MKLIIHIFYQERLHLSSIVIWLPLLNVVLRIMIKIIRSGRMTHPLQPGEKSILTVSMLSYVPFMYNWLMLLCICDLLSKKETPVRLSSIILAGNDD